jgi:AraC-like DNA-binding protein
MSPFHEVSLHPALKPYIARLTVADPAEENDAATPYKVLPGPNPVLGFQYRGRLATVRETGDTLLERSGVTGLQTSYRVFRPNPATRTILVTFRPYGLVPLVGPALDHLANQSVGLDSFVPASFSRQLEERLGETEDVARLGTTVQGFLLKLLLVSKWQPAPAVVRATQLIVSSHGQARIETITQEIGWSRRQLERVFQANIGLSPKSFASVVRFDWAAHHLSTSPSLVELAGQAGYADQAHLARHFMLYAGATPGQFKESLALPSQ